MEFSKSEYWSGKPFPSPADLPDPGIQRRSPALQVGSLPMALSEKPLFLLNSLLWKWLCILFAYFLVWYIKVSFHFYTSPIIFNLLVKWCFLLMQDVINNWRYFITLAIQVLLGQHWFGKFNFRFPENKVKEDEKIWKAVIVNNVKCISL